MRKVLLFSVLLLAGLLGSQWLPRMAGPAWEPVADGIRVLTMAGLSFIMIHVGYEFDLDKSNLRRYAWDYVVAFTAASFPWIFVTLYFVFVLLPPAVWWTPAAWQETLLAARFAAPTSAGVLFSMLAAAGLGATWLYRKARILAIFDDLDTVLLMIPLKMAMIGLAWQLGLIAVVMVVMLAIAYRYLHAVRLPVSWPWVLGYAGVITAASEIVYKASTIIDDSVPVHVEVLLPAFVLGCVLAYPDPKTDGGGPSHAEGHGDAHTVLDAPAERRVATIVAAAFMVLVGLSMPLIVGGETVPAAGAVRAKMEPSLRAAGAPAAEAAVAAAGRAAAIGRVTAAQPPPGWWLIALHVLLVTVLSNLGKMFPAFCYRREADWRERLALAVGMWPRGEVGAGVLVIALSYGIGGPVVTIAMLSLALNLVLTGAFIYVVRRLTAAERGGGVAGPMALGPAGGAIDG
ncbi:MAG: sodium:proton antiporter [Acidobacteriota bacterium]|nr:sodium:proton antiporter [Acidobacteriota bacterium]